MKKILIFALFASLVLLAGCATKQPAQEEVVEQEKVLSPMELFEREYEKLPAIHTVSEGECLWWIAEYRRIYNDPFMWPLIYKANRGQIDNPDLIYPGQTFDIPRYFSLDEVQESRKEAGAPWEDLDPQEESVIPGQLRSALGYSF